MGLGCAIEAFDRMRVVAGEESVKRQRRKRTAKGIDAEISCNLMQAQRMSPYAQNVCGQRATKPWACVVSS